MTRIERVARAIARVRERNGAAPYEAWDSVYGEKGGALMRELLFEEAQAAIDAIERPSVIT